MSAQNPPSRPRKDPRPARERERPSELRLVLTAMASDAVVLFAGYLAAFWVRFQTGWFQGPSEAVRTEHVATLVLLLPVWILVHGVNGLYRPRVMDTMLDQIGGVLKAVTLGSLLVLALGFLTRTDYFFERRLVLVFAWFFTLALSLVVRVGLIRPFFFGRFRGGHRNQRIVIVGAGVEGARFLHRIRTTDTLRYEVVGFVDDDPAKQGGTIDDLPVAGSVDDLPAVTRELQADQVFVAIPSLGQEGTLAMMSRCMKAQLPVRLVSDILHLVASDTQVETVDGVPTYDIRSESPQLGQFVKRTFDLLVAGGMLALLFPLFLFIALLIKIFSPGPVLFRQVRAGQHGREFTMCKFRTMRLETDDSIHREYATNFIQGKSLDFADEAKAKEQVFKMTKDPRITPVGALLRRTSLDELPQLLNVLRGEMSVVGPRPPIFYELNHYKEWHRKRLRAKPGLTGLWQVSGRSSVPFDEMVLLDLYYIDHWSLKTDLEILFRTVPVVLFGEGAY